MKAGTHQESLGASSFASVPDMWRYRVGSTPASIAMEYRRNQQWHQLRWMDADRRMRDIAHGLLSLGIDAEQRCIILAETSVEWVLADIAILFAGGATTTLYPSSTPEECQFIADDCEAVYIFADATQIEKLRQIRSQIPTVQRVIVFGGGPGDDWEQSLDDLEALGRSYQQAHPDALEQTSEAIRPDSMATLIYTSGTTGRPKGVVLTHDAWVYEAEALDALGFMNPADKQFLFLPLAHVFAKVMQVGFIRLGVPTVVDPSVDDLMQNLKDTRPTWMAAVPRVFEKAYARIIHQAKKRGPTAYQTFKWAVRVGRQVSVLRRKQARLPVFLTVQHSIAESLVFRPIREQFGGQIRFFISGGAPLAPEIAEFFHAIGFLVLEGYGLTESAAASCVNRLDDYKFGSVGRPVPGCEVRIAEDGEILIRSRGVMSGYHRLPDDSQQVVDQDGWLHTGDIGVILPGEHVKITGRKKDLIVTAGGKNIAPAHVEGLLQQSCPFVSAVVLHGDRRPYCTALIALEPEPVMQWARNNEVAFADFADLQTHEATRALVADFVAKTNQKLPGFEQIRDFAFLPENPSRENGLLTATLKVKRKEVEQRYHAKLDAFYSDSLPQL